MAGKCSDCKKTTTVLEVTADIEYADADFSLVVSSQNVKQSKDLFNELFEKVKKSKNGPRKQYIG